MTDPLDGPSSGPLSFTGEEAAEALAAALLALEDGEPPGLVVVGHGPNPHRVIALTYEPRSNTLVLVSERSRSVRAPWEASEQLASELISYRPPRRDPLRDLVTRPTSVVRRTDPRRST